MARIKHIAIRTGDLEKTAAILDDLTSAYDFFAAAGACCSMTLTTLPG
jgi:hypothetical protein